MVCLKPRLALNVDGVSNFYKQSKSISLTAKEFGASPAGLVYWMRKHGIEIGKQGGVKNKYELNENYFEAIESSEKAYWLGFLYADGNVYIGKQGYKTTVGLTKRDEDHLIKLKVHLSATNPISHGKKKLKGKTYHYSKLVISSKKLACDLNKAGCVPAKSLILRFPSWLPVKLRSHFIRGYFDGDGCVCRNKKSQLSVTFLGTVEFLEQVQKELVANCRVGKTKICKANKKGKIFKLENSGNKASERIRKYLYKDANIFLKRKRIVFDMPSKCANMFCVRK